MRKPGIFSLFLILLMIGNCPGFINTCLGNGNGFIKGRLPNGLTYYIHDKKSGDNRVSFYLIEKAGSINEENTQSGLAHFIEHMAFKGTRHFEGRSIIDYLQNKDVRFGRDLNAVTSFDKTVFRIENAPADSTILDTCLLILKDWGNDVSLLPEDIDSERKVIIQEWASTASSQKRIRDQLAVQLLEPDNPYRTKTPIGNIDSVKTFEYDRLRDFYYKWYRPDYQAIIVEGDVESLKIEESIKKIWGNIPKRGEYLKFDTPTLPENDHPIVGVAIDPELKDNSIDIQFIKSFSPVFIDVNEYYSNEIMEEMVASLLSYRLRERGWSNNEYIKGGMAYNGNLTVANNIPVFTIGISLKQDDWEAGLDTLIYEAKRAYVDGFTIDEFNREITDLKQRLNYLANHSKEGSLAEQFIENFISDKPVVTLQDKRNILVTFLDTVSLSGVNNTVRTLIHPNGEDSFVILRAIEKKRMDVPSIIEIEKYILAGWEQTINPYIPLNLRIQKNEKTDLIFNSVQNQGEIESETEIKELDAKKYTLSNGANVYFIKTDSPTQPVILSAVSIGGFSQFSPEDYPNYSVINNVIKSGGLGENSKEILSKIEGERQLRWNINIDEISEKFTGSSYKEDLKNLFRIMFLAFTSPGMDDENFNNWKENYKSYLKSQRENPYTILRDSITLLMYGEENTRIPLVKDYEPDNISYDRIIQLYRERFSNAADFNFIIIGDIKESELNELIETYIASLPSSQKTREEIDKSIFSYPRAIKETILFENQPQTESANVSMTIYSRMKNNLHNRLSVYIFSQLLKDIYLKEIRDKSGSAYNVNVTGDISRIPEDLLSLNINFTTRDEDYNTLLGKIDSGIQILGEGEINSSLMVGIKKGLKNDFEKYRESNQYKLNLIHDYLLYNTTETKNYSEILENITTEDIKFIADEVMNAPTVINVVIK